MTAATEAHLARRLTLPSVVAFGVSYMAPSLVMVIFGIIAVASAGSAPTAFAIAARSSGGVRANGITSSPGGASPPRAHRSPGLSNSRRHSAQPPS